VTSCPKALRRRLVALASEPYRAAGRFAYHFAKGKLGADPVFCALLEPCPVRGRFPSPSVSGARLLDLGCGQGLLAAWLLAARRLYDAGEWPADWVPPPRLAQIRGIDLCRRDLQRARLALGGTVRFEQADMRQAELGQADLVVILDALHYLDRTGQDELLRRVCRALSPEGVLLIRVGDAAAGLGFQASAWVDRAVALCRGKGLPRLHGRALADWIEALTALDLVVETTAMPAGPPFANVMLVARPARRLAQGQTGQTPDP